MLTSALALTLLVASPAAAGETRAATLPSRGVLVPGTSLGGVKLGDTPARVRARWGTRFTRCAVCARTTWLYTYPSGPRGAAVAFGNGRVSAVFTLGVPPGWRTTKGVVLGDRAGKVEDVYGELAWSRCIGYGALSMRNAAGVVSSIYTYGDSVYGFALTRRGAPVCQ